MHVTALLLPYLILFDEVPLKPGSKNFEFINVKIPDLENYIFFYGTLVGIRAVTAQSV
jgi:hypothetical protein